MTYKRIFWPSSHKSHHSIKIIKNSPTLLGIFSRLWKRSKNMTVQHVWFIIMFVSLQYLTSPPQPRRFNTFEFYFEGELSRFRLSGSVLCCVRLYSDLSESFFLSRISIKQVSKWNKVTIQCPNLNSLLPSMRRWNRQSVYAAPANAEWTHNVSTLSQAGQWKQAIPPKQEFSTNWTVADELWPLWPKQH